MKEQGSGASVEFPRCFPPCSRSPALLLMPFPPANELPLCKKKKPKNACTASYSSAQAKRGAGSKLFPWAARVPLNGDLLGPGGAGCSPSSSRPLQPFREVEARWMRKEGNECRNESTGGGCAWVEKEDTGGGK